MRLIRKLSEADNRKRKAEVFISAFLTVVLVISVPVFAWFSYQRRIAKLAKIKAPDDLYINAAHREDKIYLDMRTIDVSNANVTSQNFVFTVSGNYVNYYTLQVEHTANNPYVYSIHRGIIYKVMGDNSIRNILNQRTIQTEHSDWDTPNADGSKKYVEYTATNQWDMAEDAKVDFAADPIPVSVGDKLIIYVGEEVDGHYLNKSESARIEDDNTLTNKSYDQSNIYNRYADPLFWQKRNINSDANKGSSFYNTYVINVSWTGVSNISNYDKETDIIYISAFVN